LNYTADSPAVETQCRRHLATHVTAYSIAAIFRRRATSASISYRSLRSIGSIIPWLWSDAMIRCRAPFTWYPSSCG